jgi:hypothetical protein
MSAPRTMLWVNVSCVSEAAASKPASGRAEVRTSVHGRVGSRCLTVCYPRPSRLMPSGGLVEVRSGAVDQSNPPAPRHNDQSLWNDSRLKCSHFVLILRRSPLFWALVRMTMLILRTRPAKLSITHKFHSDRRTQRDVSEARHSTPHDGISGRRIVGTRKITAEPRDFDQIVR